MLLSRRGFFGRSLWFPGVAHLVAKAVKAGGSPGLERECELDRFFVAGFRFHDGPEHLSSLKVDGTLRMVREPANPHDHHAVALFLEDHRIGYVPRARNPTIARLLDQDAPLSCRMTVVDPDAQPWKAVEVAVAIAVAGKSA